MPRAEFAVKSNNAQIFSEFLLIFVQDAQPEICQALFEISSFCTKIIFYLCISLKFQTGEIVKNLTSIVQNDEILEIFLLVLSY